MTPSPHALHMPEIKDYCSTLAASKLIILLLEMLKFSKILFLKESKESFEIFYLQHEIFKFKKIIQKTCIEAALVFLQ